MVYITSCLDLFIQTLGSVFLCRFIRPSERTVNMTILKNKTHGNFTMISNTILKDKELSMKDRGVLCTLCSLPNGWDFSINGLSAIVPDGTSSIRASIENLERFGYILRTKTRDSKGHFTSMIEIFPEKRGVSNDSTTTLRGTIMILKLSKKSLLKTKEKAPGLFPEQTWSCL